MSKSLDFDLCTIYARVRIWPTLPHLKSSGDVDVFHTVSVKHLVFLKLCHRCRLLLQLLLSQGCLLFQARRLLLSVVRQARGAKCASRITK